MDVLDHPDFEAAQQAANELNSTLNAVKVPGSLLQLQGSLAALRVPENGLQIQEALAHMPRIDIAPIAETVRSVDLALAGPDLTRSRLADVSYAYQPSAEVSAVTGLRKDVRNLATLLEVLTDNTAAALSANQELSANTRAVLGGVEELGQITRQADARESRRSRAIVWLTAGLVILAIPPFVDFAIRILIPFLRSSMIPFARHLLSPL